MTQKSSKKRNPDVIDVVVKKSVSELPNEEVREEIILDDAKEQDNHPESEENSKDQSKWDPVSTALTPTTTLSRYLAEVRRYPFLSKEEELQLFHEYQTLGTRESAVKLILANLRVCVSIASEYGLAGIDQMDLIQEGNVGLLQAMKKFDPTKNVRFYAYAAWWVRAFVLRYLLNNFRLVKIGTTQEQRRLFYNLRREKAKLERQGYVPDPKLLADRLNVRERDVVEMDQRLGSWELSLDQPMTSDGEGTFHDLLPSTQAPIDDQLADTQLRLLFRKKLAEFAQTLSEREEDILRNRLLSESPVTLEDLGRKYLITKERTRQLEAKIIKKLRELMKKDIQDFEHLRK
ncbi:RNA polymerase factor sigma-32 [Candidatus Nitrospira allomarina]|uniref:RNA polymerase factor sigma-32 n=1 Tax=Candidatus Nitrospira allomarina TaxID=3020900 RepID=A0AA96GBW4_9BACT|nr:RNA polymerase factor sigma-32 [Candidatus Nitrospira allomarina]WNM57170.1 RNA polymerase factor sigma-32 [Candidatus Nitrospira allomarina]